MKEEVKNIYKKIIKFLLLILVFIGVGIGVEEYFDWETRKLIFILLAIISAYLLGLFYEKRN